MLLVVRSHSFAMYTKEYDVFTGDLKQRFDETRLRNEEDVSCDQRTHSLQVFPYLLPHFLGCARTPI
jgi:hypothetical protein